MTQLTGITDFLEQAGTQFCVFDMGRRIQQISHPDFLAFEMGEKSYPLPLQQQAWLGFLVWTEEKITEPVIWFLRFPLDASGKLTQGIRDDFVLRLLNKEGEAAPQEDESNPYGFKPKQEHMGCFHAKIAKQLGQPASSYYEHARDYFAGKPGYDQWAFVGFQGIADIAARLDEDNNISALSSAIAEIPEQPFEALAQCLEHEPIGSQLAEAISQLISRELNKPEGNANHLSLCIRALSNATDTQLLEHQLNAVLSSAFATNPEILASISGRCWPVLKNSKTIRLFLEALACCSEGQDFFNLVIVDLINIPGMQDSILKAVKSTERSEKLSTAIGELFKSFT